MSTSHRWTRAAVCSPELYVFVIALLVVATGSGPIAKRASDFLAIMFTGLAGTTLARAALARTRFAVVTHVVVALSCAMIAISYGIDGQSLWLRTSGFVIFAGATVLAARRRDVRSTG